MKHSDEIKEIRNFLDIAKGCDIPSNQPDEFYNFAGISKNQTGLSVNIFLDQCKSYQEYKHPLWVYITNGYAENSDFIPISVNDLKVYCDKNNLKVYQQDLTEVLCFILSHKQEICDIANEDIELSDFIQNLSFDRNQYGLVNENRILLTEMSKISSEQSGLPFNVWIGINQKEHFIGVKFAPNNSETKSDEFPEVSVPKCEVTSSKEYELWRLKYVIALIKANAEKLIELGKHPELYSEITKNLTKIDNECNPIYTEPEWIKCGLTKFGATKVRNQEGKYNFVNDTNDLIYDKWFDVANDFTMNQQRTIRAYTILNGEEGFLYLNPIRWMPIGNS